MTVTNKFKKFLILMLSLIMAFSLVLFTACEKEDTGDDDTTTTEEEETITDYQLLNNGDFEFYTTEKTTFPYSSSIKWSRSNDKSSTSSITSIATSGIIDTSDEAFN